jgi:DNA-binding PadR family transcriptional regulator
MSLKHAVLGVLEARPMSGYELTRFFESASRWVWTAPQSQIYPLLKKLEDEDLITGQELIRGEKLKRTTYSLTPAGHEELLEWLSTSHEEPNMRDPLLLQVLHFEMLDPAQAEIVLNAHIAELETNIEQWSVHRARLLAKDTPLLQERLKSRPVSDHQRIANLKAHVFSYLIESAELRIDWAKRAITLIAQ